MEPCVFPPLLIVKDRISVVTTSRPSPWVTYNLERACRWSSVRRSPLHTHTPVLCSNAAPSLCRAPAASIIERAVTWSASRKRIPLPIMDKVMMERLRQDIAPGSPVRGHLRPSELHTEPSAIEWWVKRFQKDIKCIFVFCFSLYLNSSVKWEWCKEQDVEGNMISGNQNLAEEKHPSIKMSELLCSTLILTHSSIFHYGSVFPPLVSPLSHHSRTYTHEKVIGLWIFFCLATVSDWARECSLL